MITWLAGLLGVHLPFFTYTTTRMLLAAATALVLTIGIGPAFIRMLYRLKIGQKIRTDDAPELVSCTKTSAILRRWGAF